MGEAVRRVLRHALRTFAAIAVAGLALTLPIVPLAAPAYTRVLVGRLGVARAASLTPAQAAAAAEAVRRYVTDPASPALPPSVAGRPGFDERASLHLLDVRRVIAAARAAILASATALVLALAAIGVLTRGGALFRREAGTALLAGVAALLVLLALTVVLAAADFGRFFTAFHGLFFTSGTWVFPEGSLLIELFPERFWQVSGASWAGLSVACCVVAAAAGLSLRRSP